MPDQLSYRTTKVMKSQSHWIMKSIYFLNYLKKTHTPFFLLFKWENVYPIHHCSHSLEVYIQFYYPLSGSTLIKTMPSLFSKVSFAHYNAKINRTHLDSEFSGKINKANCEHIVQKSIFKWKPHAHVGRCNETYGVILQIYILQWFKYGLTPPGSWSTSI